MDVRRTCFVEEVYLGTGDDTKTKIRWYAALPGAKIFSGPTVFRSLDWWDKLPPVPGRPGPSPFAPRRYDKGIANPAYTGQKFCGDPLWWVEGIPSPPPPGPAYGPDGVPQCCSDHVSGAAQFHGQGNFQALNCGSAVVLSQQSQDYVAGLSGPGADLITGCPALSSILAFVAVRTPVGGPNAVIPSGPWYSVFQKNFAEFTLAVLAADGPCDLLAGQFTYSGFAGPVEWRILALQIDGLGQPVVIDRIAATSGFGSPSEVQLLQLPRLPCEIAVFGHVAAGLVGSGIYSGWSLIGVQGDFAWGAKAAIHPHWPLAGFDWLDSIQVGQPWINVLAFLLSGGQTLAPHAVFLGRSYLTGAGRLRVAGAAMFEGGGSFGPAGGVILRTSGAFDGTGDYLPSGGLVLSSAPAFAGTGSFSPAGALLAPRAPAFAGTGSFDPHALHAQVFTASGSWVAPAGVTSIDVVSVGGGGGGGSRYGGGGGAGSVHYSPGTTVVSGGTYVVTIGAGGAGATNAGAGAQGADGSATTVTGPGGVGISSAGGGGGGAGGGNQTTDPPGRSGGSGGGAGGKNSATPASGGTASAGHAGGKGGIGTSDSTWGYVGGGGGGAVGLGADASTNPGKTAGNGGDGITYVGFGPYGGGGGGGCFPGIAGLAAGSGGLGGGGLGGGGLAGSAGANATANTGAGGGGGGGDVGVGNGGNGGTGIVVILWA